MGALPTQRKGAGLLRDRFAFDKRATADDGYGNTEGEFAEMFQMAAQATPLRGTEAVMASKLTGVQPYTVTVRYCADTAEIDPTWRARDLRTGVIYAVVTTAARPRRDYIDMTCTIGKAA